MFGASKSGSAVAKDPYFSSVVLLLNGEGTDGAQNNTFLDSSTNNFTVTRSANTTQGSVNPFGSTAPYTTSSDGGSLSFDGSGDYLNVATNAAFGFGTGDFTIEFWVYPTASSRQDWVDVTTPGSTRTLVYYTGTAIVFYSQPTNTAAITGPAITLNTWTYIAVSKISGSTKMFVNGTQVGSTYATSQNYGTTNQVVVGRDIGGSTYATGLISNVRILKGTGLYSANFTPPTAPLTAVTNTSLLLSGTNAGIYDLSMKSDFETVGNAQVSTTVKKYGTGSIAFDGTGDWLTAQNNTNQQLAAGDFTIEGWVYVNAIGVPYNIVSKGAAATGWSVGITVANKLQFAYTATGLTGATSLAASTWYYFTVVRSGSATGNVKLYLNGTLDATSAGAVTDNFNQTTFMYVGASRLSATPLNGYIDDLRITKGVARYTADFTAPTQSLPTS